MASGLLDGRRIAVVGAGTRRSDDPDAPMGNGRAISVLAAQAGAAVACIDVDRDAAEETSKMAGGGPVIVADVAREEDCAALVAASREGLGGLDGLVLNVGIG